MDDIRKSLAMLGTILYVADSGWQMIDDPGVYNEPDHPTFIMGYGRRAGRSAMMGAGQSNHFADASKKVRKAKAQRAARKAMRKGQSKGCV